MGNENQTEGKWDQAKGDIKEGVGNLTGNDQMAREGQWDQAKGHGKEAIGDVQEGVDKAADDWNRNNP